MKPITYMHEVLPHTFNAIVKNSINDIINTDEVQKSIIERNYYFYTKSLSNSDYHKDYESVLKEQNRYVDGKITNENSVWDYLKQGIFQQGSAQL
jgi:hypothetical protein